MVSRRRSRISRRGPGFAPALPNGIKHQKELVEGDNAKKVRSDTHEQAVAGVEGALNFWINNDMVFKGGHLIAKVTICPKNQWCDSDGIDVLVFFTSGLALPMQIKGPLIKKERLSKIKHHFEKHPHIKFYYEVNPLPKGDDDVEAHNKIASDLMRMINQALARHGSGL